MVREIKFREWETERKTMAIGEREDYDDSVGFRFDHEEGGERILMQYTGLKDTSGVDIYEGDIIRFILCDYIIKEYVEEVVYSDGAFWCGNWLLFDAKMNDDDLEVLGNIYENPVLLERETE